LKRLRPSPATDGILKRNTGVSRKGHVHRKTTEIFTHVSTKSIGKIKSPLDSLNLREKVVIGYNFTKERKFGISARIKVNKILRFLSKFRSVNESVRL